MYLTLIQSFFYYFREDLYEGNLIFLKGGSSEDDRKSSLNWVSIPWNDRKALWSSELILQLSNGSSVDQTYDGETIKLETNAHALYQWSTIGPDNQLINPKNRDLMIKGNDLKVANYNNL